MRGKMAMAKKRVVHAVQRQDLPDTTKPPIKGLVLSQWQEVEAEM